jgi:coproporphyrinogen III oxidase
MERTEARSPKAAEAKRIVEALQHYFVKRLEGLSRTFGDGGAFLPIEWYRDGGRHGGGVRYVATDENVFNRASVNISQVHYDDDPDKKLGSATALSTIIHPENPYAPSVHMHISWTQLKDGSGYWRIMADLNPAIENSEATEAFASALKEAAPAQYEEAAAQGDRYFYIPALGCHRGVTHFYLESYRTGDEAEDRKLAERVGRAVIDRYTELLGNALSDHPSPDIQAYETQLNYHTLYLFQVLTLDRGTTSGLLVHDQNDVGVLGSLPSHIDKVLLASWKNRLQAPQDLLLQAILDALPDATPCPVEDDTKQALADVVRRHYRAHPEALAMQASGDIIPHTVAHHG